MNLQSIIEFLRLHWDVFGPLFKSLAGIVGSWLGINVVNLVTKYDPKDAGAVRTIINNVSATTDSSKPIFQMKAPTFTTPKNGTINLLIAFVALSSIMGCATMKQIGSGTAQCVIENLPQTIVDAVPAVTDILLSGKSQSSIDSLLSTLGGVLGVDIACAVQKAIAILFARLPSPMMRAQPDPKIIAAIAAGQNYLKAHK